MLGELIGWWSGREQTAATQIAGAVVCGAKRSNHALFAAATCQPDQPSQSSGTSIFWPRSKLDFSAAQATCSARKASAAR